TRRCDTRADGPAVEMDGAGAALSHATSKLRSRQVQQVTQHPEERHVARRFYLAFRTIYIDPHDEPPTPAEPQIAYAAGSACLLRSDNMPRMRAEAIAGTRTAPLSASHSPPDRPLRIGCCPGAAGC